VIGVAIYYTWKIWKFKEDASEKYEEYDMQTTTSSDYTAEIKIDPKVYQAFLIFDE